MLERNAKHKFVINTLCVASILAVAMFSGLLVWRAGRLSTIEAAVGDRFSIGPIGLFEIGKTPLDGGYQATIALLPGIAMYFALWLLVAGAFVFYRLYSRGRTSR